MLESGLGEFGNIPIRLTKIKLKNQNYSISVIRDDQILFGLGTKIRKISGFLKTQNLETSRDIWIWGSLHGNFLASYTYFLKMHGFRVHVLGYSRNLNLLTANRVFIESNSHSLRLFSSRNQAFLEWEKISTQEASDNLRIPEFGFHPTALSGLSYLWSQLEKQIPKPKTIFLEIGSGLTFLSAIDFFKDSDTIVCGISVGEDKNEFMIKKNHYLRSLDLTNENHAKHFILNPLGKKKFGRESKRENQMALSLYEETGIFFEPVYGIKTWEYLMNPDLLPEKFQQPWVYLHQGGQLNHLDLILKTCNIR